MSRLNSFRVFLNDRLTAALIDILGAANKTVEEYRVENDRLRRMLRITSKKLSRIDSLQFSLSVSEEEVPPEQNWSPSLGQEDPEPTQIKEEQEELSTSQGEEQDQGLFDTKDQCDQEDAFHTPTLTGYSPHSGWKMSTIQSFRAFLSDCLTACAGVEIFRTFKERVAEYQEENDRLRRMLRNALEIQLCRIDSLQFLLSVSEEEVHPEQQIYEQEWSPSLGEEDPELTQIKEEQEEVRTSQEEGSILTPLCVKTVCQQEVPCQSLTLPQTQTMENRGSDSRPVDLQPFSTVTHLKGLDIPCEPPDNLNNFSSHSSALIRDPVGLDCSLPLDQDPSIGEHRLKLSITSRKSHQCQDCGEMFVLKADLLRHVTQTRKRPSECLSCRKRYNSTCKLKAHVRLCHSEKPGTCPVCGKTFKQKGHLTRHIRIHTGEISFSCSDCGKRFSQKDLSKHKLTHKVEKPFSCGDCGKNFRQNAHLTMHKLTHTGEKPFSCDHCGKSFSQKGNLANHKLIHTGEKPFSCTDCGKSFVLKQHLSMHKRTHTGEKPFSCGDCGKSFKRQEVLTVHLRTHTGEMPFNCGDCGKRFRHKGSFKIHIKSHTGEKPFSCGDCGKSFTKTTPLKIHLRTHTGERPFSCSDCGKTFNQKGNLTTHLRIHTRKNSLVCRDCGESFSQKEHLTEHIQNHTGEKPCRCTDCGKSFYMKADLRRHMLTHTGERPHSCSQCDKRFTTKTHLLRHIFIIHKGGKLESNNKRKENQDKERIFQLRN
ncbi:oocyte zinc finger protein XlCOF6-like isoform X1 [Esox lucius]|uniref:oocyte zinc finger protein XlCOF6-like isoform X1 n=1 Tax=Esox lucius TaxID=8010 RepID=UPI0014771E2A|nr:oocyte zinc finger protein XlCOF6-like isoform X1 [Esox lucius]